MRRIAFVGLGRMGAPMCAALVRAGYQVTATDQRAEREAGRKLRATADKDN